MSGFEALGMACAVFQTISFAHETTLFCRDIYRGQKTPDSVLEENASAMIQAADRVKAFCKAAATPHEKCLIDVAEKCTSIATKLSSEVENITELHKKGKGNMVVAVRGVFESWRKKNKMNDLDNNLRRYADTMQTLLVTRVCDQNQAGLLQQRQEFNNLDQALKAFISRIAEGHKKMEHLVQDEGQKTREYVTDEANRTVDSMNAHITTQAEELEMRKAMSSQRQRLLESFRFNEMKERMNAITDPEDACFDRILESFEKTAQGKIGSPSRTIESTASCEDSSESPPDDSSEEFSERPFEAHSEDCLEEIDRLWHSFADWLQSDGRLFWIQGKPGSGKSTLVKYIASKKVTQRLLNQWNPSTTILSHFFWKLGTSLQNDIKGLYCSLLHQLLEDKDEVTSNTMDAFPTSKSKQSYHDWSEHLCIFIDGLDEFVGDCGQEAIMQILSDFKRFTNVKVCVTSRPEPWLKEELDTVPNLKLHDLTAPDMKNWIQGRLRQFDGKRTFSPDFSSFLIRTLLDKAGGVFLWICLATQSIIRGIKNKDSEELLISRLEQLPEKLEDVYYDMWKRLGEDEPVYRNSAARYMRFMVGFQSIKTKRAYALCPGLNKSSQLTVLRMACASRPDVGRILTTVTEEVDYDMLNAPCESVENTILTNCAGLLEVYPSPHLSYFHNPVSKMTRRIEFVHRTAYDFLINTEAGRKILSYSEMTDCEVEVLMFNGLLCLLRILYHAFGGCYPSMRIVEMLPRLLSLQGSESDKEKVKDLWMTIRSFHVNGIMVNYHYHRWPPAPFASETATLGAIFDFEVQDMNSNTATSVLQNIPWHDISWDERSAVPVSGLRMLLLQGADPTTVLSYTMFHIVSDEQSVSDHQYGKRTNALWDFLHHTQWVMWQNGSEERTTPTHVVEIAADMLQKCPSVGLHGLLLRRGYYTSQGEPSYFEFSLNIYKNLDRGAYISSIFSANVAYLLDLMLWFLPQKDEAKIKGQVQFIRSKIEDPMISLRVLALPQDEHSLKCFQVIDEQPFRGVVDIIDAQERNLRDFADFVDCYDRVISLTKEKSLVTEIDPRYVRRSLVGKDILGSYEFEDGSEQSQEIWRELESTRKFYNNLQSLL
ncbi:hypothetical protein EDB82DRAFT_537513 [Fusarium venenatum]|uniref:uncharacterized protein n=1 Tax=Fusarium venenatum TaxID=56646 RepID=UPI001D467831|nr:hypothetical protein EDB82DRAFT_537513 [Fusarium venenatum]